MRDQRDPTKLGEWYLKLRAQGMEKEEAVTVGVGDYENGPFMSSNPEDHHSNVDQTLCDLSE